ncbi:MAG: S8 family serine peptidase [Planctomycetota bacterium]
MRRIQDRLLAGMGPGELKVDYRFETVPCLIGCVNRTGLAKLEADAEVVSVALTLPVSSILGRSGPPSDAAGDGCGPRVLPVPAGSTQRDGGSQSSPSIGNSSDSSEEPEMLGGGWTLADGPIHPDVYTELENSPDGTVFVIVVLKRLAGGLALEERKAAVKQIQDRVLARLAPGDFTVVCRYEISGGLGGRIARSGLDKLATDPDVVAVGPSRRGYGGGADSSAATGDLALVEASSENAGAACGIANREPRPSDASDTRPGAFPAGPDGARAWNPSDGPIHPDVYPELENSADGTAFVVAHLKPVGRGLPLEQRMGAVKQVQDGVLERLAPEEFTVVYRYEVSGGLAGRITRGGLDKLGTDPNVLGVGPSRPGHGALSESVPFIGADQVQADLGVTGRGVTVAVLDTGIDSDHPDLVSSIAGEGYTFLGNGTIQYAGAEDDHGHGTLMAGIITSDGNVASKGVAPDACILPIKVQDQTNNGYTADWTAGVNYVVAHRNEYDNLRVINMSFGTVGVALDCPCDWMDPQAAELEAALSIAKDYGIVSFAATMNNAGCNGMSSPACLTSAIPVAAVYDADYGREPDIGTYRTEHGSTFRNCADDPTYPDRVACFSNQSWCNRLAAPGIRIDAPWLGGGTATGWGTSEAAAHCSGVAALMCEQRGCGGLSPDEIESAMYWSGVVTSSPCPPFPLPIRVNALAAVSGIGNMCYAPLDTDCDGAVDLGDVRYFVSCLTGPGGGPVGGICRCADVPGALRDTGDGDVDLADFAAFQRAFPGGGQ